MYLITPAKLELEATPVPPTPTDADDQTFENAPDVTTEPEVKETVEDDVTVVVKRDTESAPVSSVSPSGGRNVKGECKTEV